MVSSFPIDAGSNAANQREMQTAMGRAFGALNSYMANLMIMAEVESRILDVAVRASNSLKKAGAKGYLVEINIYKQASGVPAWGADFLVDVGEGENPDSAYFEAARRPSLRPPPYSSLYDADRSQFLWFERDGASVKVGIVPPSLRQFITEKTKQALARPSIAGSWSGNIVIEGESKAMTMRLAENGGSYQISYSLAGRQNREICVQKIDVSSRVIAFRPSCKAPANSLLFTLNIASDYRAMSGFETDEADQEVKYPIHLQKQ